MSHTIRHSVEELSPFPKAIDQMDYRRQLVLDTLAKENIPFEFDAIIGRGGLLRPIPGGVYEVNEPGATMPAISAVCWPTTWLAKSPDARLSWPTPGLSTR